MGVNNPGFKVLSSSGSYAGNSTQNRAIPHGFPTIPKMVTITATLTAGHHVVAFINSGQPTNLKCFHGHVATGFSADDVTITTGTTTNFYVGDAGANEWACNTTGITYYWEAQA